MLTKATTKAGSRTVIGGVDPLSWDEEARRQEDPFFAIATHTLGLHFSPATERATDDGDTHRGRFSNLLSAAVKPPKSSD